MVAITRYVVEGSTYLQIDNWLKHQKIDRPTPSRLPVVSEATRLLASPREASSTDLGPWTVDHGPRTEDHAAPIGARSGSGELDFGETVPPPRAAKAPTPSDAETELFRRGKEVLGNGAGGLVSRLLKAKGGKVPLARAAIEQASTKHDPREYIGAIIRAPPEHEPSRVVQP